MKKSIKLTESQLRTLITKLTEAPGDEHRFNLSDDPDVANAIEVLVSTVVGAMEDNGLFDLGAGDAEEDPDVVHTELTNELVEVIDRYGQG